MNNAHRHVHLLVVDDDDRIRDLLSRILVREGYWCSKAADSQQVRALLRAFKIDLIILDVMMPDEDGVQLTHDLRRDNSIPIIMHSALGDIESRLEGLNAGADDYLPKPCDTRELVAKIEAVLTRTREVTGKPSGKIRFGDFLFDLDRRELTRSDDPVKLTESEAALLWHLARHPNQPASRSSLVAASSANGRAMDVIITRLRAKLGEDARNPRHLKTLRNVGYMLVADPTHPIEPGR